MLGFRRRWDKYQACKDQDDSDSDAPGIIPSHIGWFMFLTKIEN